ncbi:MAG: glycosyltransferase [Candidatus Moranbacteria bacterium]|nr:glycosyltransferase [Candidatus Moranbacteria bacterium]
MLAPIVLFVYNRPWHTRKTLESLEKNDLAKESELFIFSDGPKEGATREQLEKISETRKVIKEKKWCGKVNILEREKNMGLANSVIGGVTEIIGKFGKIIVLEDDFLLSKNFLKYMNNALERFEKEEKIMQISGYTFPADIPEKVDAFFLPFTTSWGWGTWKRVWDIFDESAEGAKILDENKELRYKFDLEGSYPYYKMLKAQQNKKVDSWAIRFYLSVFLKNGLTLYPRKTLVNNIGFDGSGVHCRSGVEQGFLDDSFTVNSFPDNVVVDKEDRVEIFRHIKKQNNFFRKLMKIIARKVK